MVAWQRVAVVFVVALLAAAGCNSSGDSVAEQTTATTDSDLAYVFGIPARAEDTYGPGTPLRDGFEVAEGSILLGGVFPNDVAVVYAGEPIEDRGWTADLLVDGDPLEVFDAYADQAEAVGLPKPPPASESCIPSTEPPTAIPVEGRSGPEGLEPYDETAVVIGVDCEASTGTPSLAPSDTLNARRFFIHLQRGPGPVSHLLLHYTLSGEGTATGEPLPARDQVTLDYLNHYLPQVGDIPEPSGLSLPGEGDVIGEIDVFEGRKATVPQGTEVVVAATHTVAHCSESVHSAVLRLTGDLEPVIEHFEAEINATRYGPPVIKTRHDDGFTVTDVDMYSSAGSGMLDVTVYAPEDTAEPTYITVLACNSS